MADFPVIRAVSESLRELLREHITLSSDPGLNNVPIDLRSPRELREAGVARVVSLWLYRVVRNPDLLNLPPERRGTDQFVRRPLPLELHYLLTPVASRPDDEQLLLGRALQTLHDHASLEGTALRDTLADSNAELRLVLETLNLEELTRVWQALQESYQLSVSYLAQVVEIDSAHEPVRRRVVLERHVDHRQILAVQ
jgi:hypothetical protein